MGICGRSLCEWELRACGLHNRAGQWWVANSVTATCGICGWGRVVAGGFCRETTMENHQEWHGRKAAVEEVERWWF